MKETPCLPTQNEGKEDRAFFRPILEVDYVKI